MPVPFLQKLEALCPLPEHCALSHAHLYSLIQPPGISLMAPAGFAVANSWR